MPLQRNRLYHRQVYKTGTIFSVGPTTARYLILILLGVCSVFYLFQQGAQAQISSDIRNLDGEQHTGQQELTTLQIQAARFQSLQSLNETASKDGLVSIGNPDTFTVPAK